MHAGWMPLYYIFKMLLSIFVTLLRKKQLEVVEDEGVRQDEKKET